MGLCEYDDIFSQLLLRRDTCRSDILNNKYLLEKAHTHTSRAGIMSVPRSSLKCLGLKVSQRLDPTIVRLPMPYAH